MSTTKAKTGPLTREERLERLHAHTAEQHDRWVREEIRKHHARRTTERQAVKPPK